MLIKKCFLLFLRFSTWVILASSISSFVEGLVEEGDTRAYSGPVVRKEERRSIVSTEYGEISAVRVGDNINGSYLLHFFTLEPDALFLPVVLHADMVFYVHTGSGQLSWAEEEEDLKHSYLSRGDVFRLEQGTVFYIQAYSQYESDQDRLKIHAIFANSNDDLREPATGPYSSVPDAVRGFRRRVLQSTFQVPEEVIDELLAGTKPPLIVHAEWDTTVRSTEGQAYNILDLNKKKKEKEKEKGKEEGKQKEERGNAKLFNLLEEEKDVENCNGWSTLATSKKLSALKGSNVASFMVDLKIGSMMAPHWNPSSSEISIVLQGRGMVRVLCSHISNDHTCQDMRYEVEQGDVFVVPRFNPVAQMSFNNDTFVFMGFSTSTKRSYPRFLGGEYSVLRALGKRVLAMSFNVSGATLDRLLAPKDESVIVGCVSCAEEELTIMWPEMEPEGEEEHGGGGEEEEGAGGEKEEEVAPGGENYGYEKWRTKISMRKRRTV